MEVAALSLIALIVVIILSCVFPKINPGIMAIIAALLLGTLLADLTIKEVLAAFPSELFLLLISICLVFGIASQNGTLSTLVQKMMPLIRGNVLLLPVLIFLMSFGLSAVGPGNIAAVALLASIAMSMATKYRISFLLMAIMLVTGANAGAFSPIAPTGVIAARLMHDIGLEGTSLSWTVFIAAAILQSLTALVAYAIFLLRAKRRNSWSKNTVAVQSTVTHAEFTQQQVLTLGVIATMIGLIVFFQIPMLLVSLLAVVTMGLMGLGEPEEVLKDLPWSTILMVTGIAVLIGLMEKTGGLDLATTLIASVTQPGFIHAALAFITGIVSAYSSSSGVVMPAFIPLLPSLAEKMGIDNIVKMVIAVAVGSHMVDVSPLSTLGALALAAITVKAQRARVFKGLMTWGMSMAVVGGLIAFVFLDVM